MLPGILGLAGFSAGSATVGLVQTDIRDIVGGIGAHTFTACNYGTASGRSGVIVLAYHGDTSSSTTSTPTCTLSGGGSTRYEPQTTGSGGGAACGTVIFAGTPGGTSGDIIVDNWSAAALPISIIVFAVYGYNITPNFTFGGSSSGGDAGSKSVTFATDEALIVAGTNTAVVDIVWSNVTERGQDGMGSANNTRGWAWDINEVSGTRTVSLSPWSGTLGSNSWSCIKLAKL
jgi:hypothetical protein